MRNYLKMQAMHWTTSNGDDLWAWGGTDEQLLFYVERMERFWIDAIDPNAAPFNRTSPEVCWFELDQENFGIILNNVGIFSAFDTWKLTMLNNGQFPVLAFGNINFFDITRVKVQGSPRKSWSHGH